MANKSNFSHAPKRRIERVNNRINHLITNATTNTIMHTCEDRKTLVRAIIQLDTAMIAPCDYTVLIQRAPRGITVAVPATAEALDSNMTKEQVWEYTSSFVAGVTSHVQVLVDLKSMRKLDPGDTVVMRDISNVPNSVQLTGTVTLFFKE